MKKLKDQKDQPAQSHDSLFRQALDGVIPLPASNRTTVVKPPTQPSYLIHPARPPIPDTLSDHGAEDKLLTEFLRPGISQLTLRKLRRGQWPLQDSLDLHGLHSEAARKLLLEFMLEVTQHQLRCVCVIHGKGRHTEGGEGILKSRVRHWLTQCPEVLAFCETPPQEGGSGAVKVLLKNVT